MEERRDGGGGRERERKWSDTSLDWGRNERRLGKILLIIIISNNSGTNKYQGGRETKYKKATDMCKKM